MPPPKRLENFLRWLLPPACREHVLGDLHERYQTPKLYLIDALSVLGPVIIGRVQRTTDFQVILMEVFAIYSSFTTTAWYLGQQKFLYSHFGFVRLAVPTTISMVTLLLCNAYSDPEKRSLRKPIAQSVSSISLAFLGQAFLFNTQSSFVVPFSIMLYGSFLSLLLVSALRMLFPPVEARPKFIRLNERQQRQNQRFVRVNSPQHLWRKGRAVRHEPEFALLLPILVAGVAALLAALAWHAVFLIRLAILTTVILAVICWFRAGR